jgi:hypothetical protein
VLVLIHGGGFEMGSSLEFANFTDIGANFVRHGIVVVSIQYRLGQLGKLSWEARQLECKNGSGFASTGDSVLPGNLGLWDQVAALQFIQDNIASFGGNPRQVTLLGQSAGSASVSALGLSPHSRGGGFWLIPAGSMALLLGRSLPKGHPSERFRILLLGPGLPGRRRDAEAGPSAGLSNQQLGSAEAMPSGEGAGRDASSSHGNGGRQSVDKCLK